MYPSPAHDHDGDGDLERASERTARIHTWGSRVNNPVNASSSSKLRPWPLAWERAPGGKPAFSSARDKSAENFPTRLYGLHMCCAAKEVRGFVTRERVQYRMRAFSILRLPLPPSTCVGIGVVFLSTIYPRCVLCILKNSCRQVRSIRRDKLFFLK